MFLPCSFPLPVLLSLSVRPKSKDKRHINSQDSTYVTLQLSLIRDTYEIDEATLTPPSRLSA